MQKINFQNLPNTTTPVNATNLNLLQDNVENAIDGVVDSGSNANGNYVKLDDGTMICYLYRKDFSNVDFTTSIGSLYNAELTDPFTFPVSFVGYPTVIVNSQSSGDYYFSTIYGIIRDSTKISKISLLRPTSTQNVLTTLGYVAIGKWK